MRRDRPFLLSVLTILMVLAVSQLVCAGSAYASAGLLPGDYCNNPGEKRTPWTRAAKEMTRERVHSVLRTLGVSPAIVAYHEVIMEREAFGGEASVRHTLGTDEDGTPEDGLGTHGLALRWHSSKWGRRGRPGLLHAGGVGRSRAADRRERCNALRREHPPRSSVRLLGRRAVP